MGARNLALALGNTRDLGDRRGRHQRGIPDLAEVMMSGTSPDRIAEAKRQIEQIKRDLDLSNDDIRCVYGLMMRDQALRSSSPPYERMKR